MRRTYPQLLNLFLTLPFIILLSIDATRAQTTTATLSGTVTDAQGATVAGASVTVLNPATGQQRQTVTNDEGFFTVAQLSPSAYTVRATRDGFAPATINDVVLNVGDQRSLQIGLQAGEVTEAVNVEGEATLVDTSPSVSTTINQRFVENLPLNGRTLQALIQLAPGVVRTNGAGQFSINGQRDNANYFTIDGVSANVGVIDSRQRLGQAASGSVFGFNAQGSTNSLISVDALQEFKIQTSTYAAEFGRQPGGQIQLVSRSGANQFTGTVFEYFRNEALDANDFYHNRAGLERAPRRQHDFGGVLGGPVFLPRFGEGGDYFYDGRNRTFFFFSYENLRLDQPQTVAGNVPSLAFRQSAPEGLRPFLNALPLPNSELLFGSNPNVKRFVGTTTNPQKLSATSIRIDQVFGDRLTVFGRYNYAPSEFTERELSIFRTREVTPATLTLSATAVFSPRVTNELKFNYSTNRAWNRSRLDTIGGATPLPDAALFPAGISTPERSFVRLNIEPPTDGFALSSSIEAGTQSDNRQRQINVVDNFSVTAGAHNLRFGVDYRYLFPRFAPRDYALTAVLQPNFTVRAPTIESQEQITLEFHNLSVYAQDSWKINRHLTLDYGLRYELNPAPRGSNKPLYTLTGLENLATIQVAPEGTRLYPTKFNNFAPRVGASFLLSNASGRETVLRGGYGLYYDLGTGTAGDAALFFPYLRRRNFNVPAGTLFSNFLNSSLVAPPAEPSFTPPYGGANPQLFLAFDPDYESPRTHQFSASVEQSLGRNQSVTVSYVGAIGRNLLRRETLRQVNARFNSTSQIYVARTESSSDYHAAQAQFQRRLSRRLQVLASYTFAKSIDNISLDENEGGLSGLRLASPIGVDRGASDFDARHQFNAAVSYDIPTPNMGKVGNAIFRSFSVDALINARSALPVDVYYSRSVNGATVYLRPDLIGGVPVYVTGDNVRVNVGTFEEPELVEAVGGRAFNRAPVAGTEFEYGAFRVPVEIRQGTLGRNALRGQPLRQVDLTLRRTFNLSERLNLQLRAEAFNVFNTTNFIDQRGFLGFFFGSGATAGFGSSFDFGRSTTTPNNVPFEVRSFRDALQPNPLYRNGGARSIQLAVKLNF